MNSPPIVLSGLTRYFGVKPVVQDLDFQVQHGQVTALLGLNGAGKTTTIRMLMGLLAPTRGSATTFGTEALTMSVATRSRIGYLVEGHFLYPSLRVRECETFQRVGHAEWNGGLFRDIVRHFGIDVKTRVGDLSRGQRAGVALALVLAPNPELLVLDDPALGLDPVSRRALNETLIEFAGDGQRTVLLSSHLLDDVERIADRIAVMIDGRLMVDAPLDEFCRRVKQFELHGASINQSDLASIPRVVESRQLGQTCHLTVVDPDDQTRQAVAQLGSEPEVVEASFSDAILAYLARRRADHSFLEVSANGDSLHKEQP